MGLAFDGSGDPAGSVLSGSSAHDTHHGADPSSLLMRIQTLARAVSTTSSVDGLLRLVVLRTLSPLGCHAAGMFALDTTGVLRLVSSYGYPSELPLRDIDNLDDRIPVTYALHTGSPVWLHDDDFAERFPDLVAWGWPDDRRTAAVFPLGDVTPSALFWITSCQRIEPNTLPAHYFETVAALLGIAIDPLHGRVDLAARPRSRVAIPGQLSERQIAILRLIADGRTNKAIGARLGYSESTVRHETMRIFRTLGVASRSQAVTEAMARGLVSPSGLEFGADAD